MAMALKIFCSYSHKDDALRAELMKHLSWLQRDGLIESWDDRRLEPGDEWRQQIDNHIQTAHIILLLISADFMASEYINDVELKVALERHRKNEAIVIPVILEPCEWRRGPIGFLQAVPQDGKAVTLWANQAEAFAAIAHSIGDVAQKFQPKPSTDPAKPPVIVPRHGPQQRMVDAAIPSHIVKDRSTELHVLIRLPDSKGLAGVLQEDEGAEARPEDVRSKGFDVEFPMRVDGSLGPLKMTVRVSSLDFEPNVQEKNILVPPDKDSDDYTFYLVPRQLGKLSVTVELQWEDAVRGSRSLRTECTAQAASGSAPPKMNLVQMPVEVAAGNRRMMRGGAEAAMRPSTQVADRSMRGGAPAPEDTGEHETYKRAMPPPAPPAPMQATENRRVPTQTQVPPAPAPTPEPVRRSRWYANPAWTAPLAAVLMITASVSYFRFNSSGVKPNGHDPVPSLGAVVYTGKIVDSSTSEAVPFSKVTMELEDGRKIQAVTDKDGNFHLDLKNVQPGAPARISVDSPKYEVAQHPVVISNAKAAPLQLKRKTLMRDVK
jgi:hypothetical protein